jgi:hypothetical protein
MFLKATARSSKLLLLLALETGVKVFEVILQVTWDISVRPRMGQFDESRFQNSRGNEWLSWRARESYAVSRIWREPWQLFGGKECSYLKWSRVLTCLSMPVSAPMGRKIFQDKSVAEPRLDEGGEMLCSDSTGSVLSLQWYQFVFWVYRALTS